MEFMDGSLEQLAGVDVPEPVLAKVTSCVVNGLKFLKDELQTMHRGNALYSLSPLCMEYLADRLAMITDVKPTNVLVSRSGGIKLCDFGVSAQLERSLAKTNIGCQSYMAVSFLILNSHVYKAHAYFSPSLNASRASLKDKSAHTLSRQMFGLLVCQ